MKQRHQICKHLVFDFLTGSLSWFLFISLIEDSLCGVFKARMSGFFFVVILGVAFFWVLLYYLSGYYKNIFQRSRFNEVSNTFVVSFVGVLLLFTLLSFRIAVPDHFYDDLIMKMLPLHFSLTLVPRMILSSITIHKIHAGKLGWNCLLIGQNQKALSTFFDVRSREKQTGERISGYIQLPTTSPRMMDQHVPYLGQLQDVNSLIQEHRIEYVIIAVEEEERSFLPLIMKSIDIQKVSVKIIPEVYDILTGSVRMHNIYGNPLIDISALTIPIWQQHIKFVMDKVLALLALIITLPASVALAIMIRFTSKGSVIYSHERIGKDRRPFRIYKFRSMWNDAENGCPQLASDNDERITPLGRIMRRYRLDEIPNLVNVLKGDMSLVGPRPERIYFINQIIEKAPHYLYLHKIKPGITSLGQVKYGYAATVDEMIHRMRYDLIYLENMSVFLDMKILFSTISTILKGKGV